MKRCGAITMSEQSSALHRLLVFRLYFGPDSKKFPFGCTPRPTSSSSSTILLFISSALTLSLCLTSFIPLYRRRRRPIGSEASLAKSRRLSPARMKRLCDMLTGSSENRFIIFRAPAQARRSGRISFGGAELSLPVSCLWKLKNDAGAHKKTPWYECYVRRGRAATLRAAEPGTEPGSGPDSAGRL